MGCQPSCMAVTQPALKSGCWYTAITSPLQEQLAMHLLQLVQPPQLLYTPACICCPCDTILRLGAHSIQSNPRMACATQPDPTQAHACMQTPMCLISLVAEDRQWFKSQKGMGCTGSDRNASFCAWMLLPKHPEMLVVEDATLDSRWAGAWHAGPVNLGHLQSL